MKTCINCKKSSGCAYKYMGYVCDMWQASVSTIRLRQKAQEIENMRMDFKEKQFVISCQTAEAFTPKQIHWLNSLIKRFKKQKVSSQ